MQATATTPQSPTVVLPGPGGETQTLQVPRTGQELRALRVRRSELSDQLVSANGRRDQLARELRNAMDGADRSGIEQRIAQLDQRIVGLEADIANTGRELTSAPAGLLASERVANRVFGFSEEVAGPLAAAFTIFVLAPLAIASARLLWKRGKAAPVVQESRESTMRMERIEQAVDAIAIEVERISEAQRFTTRLLAERQPPLEVGAGVPQAEPVPVARQADPVPAVRARS